MEDLRERLKYKIKVLTETVWEEKLHWPDVERWLENFSDAENEPYSEELHALYLLSQFMYFGSREIRELLRALYRDLFRYPLIKDIRKGNKNTRDTKFLEKQFSDALSATRFLGIGNPSESGPHLLYYFRQENALPKDLFIHAHEALTPLTAKVPALFQDNEVHRLVFIDDFCGSGSQATEYSKHVLRRIRNAKPDLEISYFVLFALRDGLDYIRRHSRFDKVDAIYELDDSYRCFTSNTRYFTKSGGPLNKDFAASMCQKYGMWLVKDDPVMHSSPLGWRNGQLLLGFHHNTPDNTLPIIWYDEKSSDWVPIFRRYPKVYGGL